MCPADYSYNNDRGECIPQKYVNEECATKMELEVLDLCPKQLIGLYAPPNKYCYNYFDCFDGLLGGSGVCRAKQKFDNIRGECVKEDLVDSNCNGKVLEVDNEQHQTYVSSVTESSLIPGPSDLQDESEPKSSDLLPSITASVAGDDKEITITVEDEHTSTVSSHSNAEDGILDTNLCPEGYNGYHVKEDCTQYYECTDGWVGSIHTCPQGLKFDKVRNRCSSEEVSQFCYGAALEAAAEQNKAISSAPNSSPTSESESVTTNASSPTAPKHTPPWLYLTVENGSNRERSFMMTSNLCLAVLPIMIAWLQ